MQLKKHVRLIGLSLLAVVTAYGIYQSATGDSTAVLAYWRHKGLSLIAATALTALGIGLDGICWIWLCTLFGIRVRDTRGVAIFLSAHAGMLVPVHLGNLIRPDVIVRLGRGTWPDCLRVELAVLFLDVAAAVVLMSALLATLIHPLAGAVTFFLVAGLLLSLADRLTQRFSTTFVAMPPSFWKGWRVPLMLLLTAVGCFLQSLAFYLLVRDLPGRVGLVETLFAAPFSASLAAGTGLPGGIGAAEALLGTSLKIMHVPAEHLAPAVAAFRMVTFWLWLPVGWIALTLANRTPKRDEPRTDRVNPT